ncbi:hypothetical protein G7Y79_00021g050400 [Physcia stellaris]|nr:hypothetical protein G7Y79_00021g050400 [Physcia stellaris]
MGLTTLIQRFQAGRDQRPLSDVGKVSSSFNARSKQPLLKALKPFASFKGTFKQAFKSSKAQCHSFSVVTDPQPHEDEDRSSLNQKHPLNDVGCVKYIDTFVVKYVDTFVVADLPPTPAASPKLSTGEGAVQDLLKTSTHAAKNTKPEGSPSILCTEVSKAVGDGQRSNIIRETAGRGSETPLALYIGLLPSHKRSKSWDHSIPKTTLQRTRSQTSLARYINPYPAKPSTIISRRSSISHQSHSDVRDTLPSLTGPVQADLENGMLKLYKRTACIELALSQQSLDRKCFSGSIPSSECSAFERHDILTIRAESSGTDATCPSSDSIFPEDNSHLKNAELVTLGGTQVDNADTDEITALNAQVASLQSEKVAIQQKCDEDIAFKDEQMQTVVSMCQRLSAEKDELKAQVKQPATSPPVRSPVQQATTSELAKLRKVVKVQDEAIAFKDEQMRNVVSKCQTLSAEKDELKIQNGELSDARRTIDRISGQLKKSEATEQQQTSQLYKAFALNQDLGAKLAAATNANKQLEGEVEKLRQLKVQVTGEFIDAKSECERTYLQNRILTQALALDPAKAAVFHNTNENLKKEIADQEERRIQAEELNIQLQKRHEKERVESKAEITALTEKNKTLNLAIGDLQSSKRALLFAIDDYLIRVPGRDIADSIKVAVKSFRSAAKHDQAIDRRLNEIIGIQSGAVTKAKGLEIHCHQLETAAKDHEIKYMDLEADFRGKSSKVDAMEMEAECKASEHQKALTKKDDEISKAKKAATHAENLLELLKDSQADVCTTWFFKRAKKEVTKAKDDLKHAEKRIEGLEQDLHAKIHFEKMDKGSRDDRNWKAATEPDAPALRNEIAQLKEKLEDFEKGLCIPDVVPLQEHLRRLDEVRQQTTAQLQNESRQQLEATINAQLVTQFGNQFVIPLQDLCSHLWNRNLSFENYLKQIGIDEDSINTSERGTLLHMLHDLSVIQ